MKPINIVYLHAHDAGRYIQPYGYGIETPHLQTLAESGMLFRQAFTVNPTCSPSRACLMTGQTAHTNGMLGLAHRGFCLTDYDSTLVRHLGRAGWQTALSGVQHIAMPPAATVDDIGYDRVLFNEDVDSQGVSAAAEAFLAEDHQKPFFLDVGYFPPHRIGDGDFPREKPVPNPAYVRPPAHLPDTPETRQDFAEYMASVSTFDQHVGRILTALEQQGLADTTLVIATTDHGIAFPGMKCRLTDHGLGVMLMLRGPGGFEGGKVTDAMVSHLDVFPTICDVLGLPLPDGLEGHSLCPLAKDPQTTLRDAVYAEVNVHAAYEPMRAVRTERWKYISHFEERDQVILANCDNGLTKGYLCDHGWAGCPPKKEELYDLVLDPNESCNRIDDASCREELDTLREKLQSWMQATDDPLLQGPLDLTGKTITPADAYSPSGAPRAR